MVSPFRKFGKHIKIKQIDCASKKVKRHKHNAKGQNKRDFALKVKEFIKIVVIAVRMNDAKIACDRDEGHDYRNAESFHD